MSTFDARQCCDDMSEALKPVLAKYRHFMDQATQNQYDEGAISEHEALCRLIDPAIEADLKTFFDSIGATQAD